MAATHTKFELVRKINTIVNKQVAIQLLDILNMCTANAWVIKVSNPFHDINAQDQALTLEQKLDSNGTL